MNYFQSIYLLSIDTAISSTRPIPSPLKKKLRLNPKFEAGSLFFLYSRPHHAIASTHPPRYINRTCRDATPRLSTPYQFQRSTPNCPTPWPSQEVTSHCWTDRSRFRHRGRDGLDTEPGSALWTRISISAFGDRAKPCVADDSSAAWMRSLRAVMSGRQRLVPGCKHSTNPDSPVRGAAETSPPALFEQPCRTSTHSPADELTSASQRVAGGPKRNVHRHHHRHGRAISPIAMVDGRLEPAQAEHWHCVHENRPSNVSLTVRRHPDRPAGMTERSSGPGIRAALWCVGAVK